MFEQDYIMRLVREIARVIAKLLFNIDSETLTEDLQNRLEETDTLKKLLDMVDEGQINEAENCLDDLLCAESPNSVEIAILFYYHLNEKTDMFLEGNGFSREEVKLGMEKLAGDLGLSGLADAFFKDS
ncbi:MAG: hypothetical protein IJ419_06840 [Agathobacter sp.]|nr:hypothetical protein [Agathobacter sp.]